MQKRIGKNEQLKLNRMLKLIRKFKVFTQHKGKGETYFNNLLINHLKQNSLAVRNISIPTANLFGEISRPECFIDGSGKIPLCAVECKKLTEGAAKVRWKEGLSQAILYTHFYKAVVLVFYDYTKKGQYAAKFSSNKSAEATFADSLRKAFRIYVVVLRTQK